MVAIVADMLAIEDCDVVGDARRKVDTVLESEFRLLRYEDVVAEASKSISTKNLGINRKAAHMT